jgi:ABC-2 type transport system ATP-binding protein
VAFDHVTKRFGNDEILHGLTFAVPWGQILGIIGPSGSGKTTTVRMMLGMYRPTSGKIQLFGRNPWRLRHGDKERIGYMPQEFILYPDLTVEENLRLAASLYGVPWWEARRRLREVLPFVELADARRQRVADLSGGMRRRLSLAATLMHNPDFLVLDEPTSGIDPIVRTSIWEGLRDARDGGKTFVVTTHYVSEAEHCDLVILIDAGRIIATGTPAELRRAGGRGGTCSMCISPRRDPIAPSGFGHCHSSARWSPSTGRIRSASSSRTWGGICPNSPRTAIARKAVIWRSSPMRPRSMTCSCASSHALAM